MRIIITHDFSPFFTFSKIMGRKTSRYCEKLHDPKPLLSAYYMANLFFHRDRDPFTNFLHKICIKYIEQGLSRIVCELRSQIRHSVRGKLREKALAGPNGDQGQRAGRSLEAKASAEPISYPGKVVSAGIRPRQQQRADRPLVYIV